MSFDEKAMERKIKKNLEQAGFTIETMRNALFQELKHCSNRITVLEGRACELIDQISYINKKYGGKNEKN